MQRERRFSMATLRELRLPRPEREAARAERRAEEAIRRERDNPESAEQRAAAIAAEARRHGNHYGQSQ